MVEARRIVDEFRILKLLKAAPQTTVFHAEDPGTGRPVVLKLLNALGGNPPKENRRRFEELGLRMGEASLPCLPELLDFGFTPDGRAFLVTSFEDGQPLTELKGESTGQNLALLASLAACLDSMASAGLVHHNVATSNVLVIGTSLHLLGLGSAAFLGAGASGGLMGHSPDWDAFAAPELMDAELGTGQPAWKADLYSAALVACHVLQAAVETPAANHPVVTLPDILRTELADLVGVEEVLSTCLRRDPSERRITLAELAETLRTGGEAAPMPDLADLGAPGPASKQIAPPPVAAGHHAVEMFDPNKTRPSFTPEEMAAFVAADEASDAAVAETGEAGEGSASVEEPAVPPELPGPEIGESPPPLKTPAGSEEFGAALDSPSPPPPPSPPEKAAEPRSGSSFPQGAAGLTGDASPPNVPAQDRDVPHPDGDTWKDVVRARSAGFLQRARKVLGQTDRRILAGAGAGLVLLLAVLLIVVLGRGGGAPASEGPSAPVKAGPAVVVVQPEPEEPGIPETPQEDPRLQEAQAALEAGDVATARKTLAALTPGDVVAFGDEDRAAYDELQQAIKGSSRDRAVRDLRRGLRRGDIRRLRRAMRTLDGLPRSELSGVKGLRRQMNQARKALQLHTLLWRAKKAGDDLQVIERARDLLAVLPAYSRAKTLRRDAAASVEAKAAEEARQRRFADAARLVENEKKVWPERQGLDTQIERYRRLAEQDQLLERTLQQAQKALDAGDPAGGLRILGTATPSGPFVTRFGELRDRMEKALAARDVQPPKIALKPGFKLRFKKNQTLVVPFTVTDDLGVTSVVANLRRKGERNYSKVPLRHVAGDLWILDLKPELHGNANVELFLVASDASGHKGVLGTGHRPLKVLRKRWYQK